MNVTVNKVLIVILVFLVLLDIVLFSYYIQSSEKFITNDPSYIFKTGEVKILSAKTPYIGTVKVEGIIKSKVRLENGVYILEVIVKNANNKKITVNLVLGNNDDQLPILLSKGGVIKNPIIFNTESVKGVLKYLHKGYLLIFSIPYGNTNIQSFKKDSECDKECIKLINNILNYTSSSDKFIFALDNNQIVNNLYIGPVFTLVIYEK